MGLAGWYGKDVRRVGVGGDVGVSTMQQWLVTQGEAWKNVMAWTSAAC